MKRPILVGFLLGALYWCLEALIDSVVFHRGTFSDQLLPEAHNVWVRLLVWALMILFGIYARHASTPRTQDECARAYINNLLNILHSISQLAGQEKDPRRLIQEACDRLAQIPNYHNVWVALLDDSRKVITAVETAEMEKGSAVLKYLHEGRLPACARSLLKSDALTLSKAPHTCQDCPLSEIAKENIKHIVITRLEESGILYGILGIYRVADGTIEGETQLLEKIARDIAFALRQIDLEADRQRVEIEHRRRTAQLEALRQVNLKITAQLDLDTLLHSIAAQAIDLLKCESGGLYLYNPGQDAIEWRVSVGKDPVAIGSKLHYGEGLAGKAWQQGKPLTVDDYSAWDERASIYNNIPVAAVVSAPVRWGDELLGVLNVNAPTDQARTFSPADMELLDLFAAQAAIAIRNARLYEEAQRRAEQMAIVNRIAKMIGKTLNLDSLLQTVYQELEPIFQPDAFFVALYDEETEELDYRIQVDEGHQEPPVRRPLDTSLTAQVIREGTSLLIRNYEQERDHLPTPELWGTMKPAISWLSVPMEASNHTIGVITVQAYRPNAYGEEEELLLSTIAEQVAVAVESVQLFDVASQEIIERMHAEEALYESEVRLRQQARLAAVGQLAGGIAHDFNNILTTITLYAQMVLSAPAFPKELSPSLQTILDEARGASHLIQQTLDFSRRSTIDTRPTDLVSLIEETLDILRRTLPENLRLLMEIGADEYVVMADATRIQQMMMNLALNARDAMPEGGELHISLARVHVTVDRSYPETVPSGEWVRLTVSDTGTGMTEEVRQHLFEPFFTTKQPGEGTGLGLAQVYGIVKSHKGYIAVRTKVGEGTMFRIYLPLHRSEEPIYDRQEEEADVPSGRGEVILVVEDEAKVRGLVEDILESLNYEVVTANNGKQALEVYQSLKKVDLLLTDLIMPEMGGRQLIRQIRKRTSDLKAVAITGYAMADNVQALKDDGFSRVLHKPFEIQSLARIVRETLDDD